MAPKLRIQNLTMSDIHMFIVHEIKFHKPIHLPPPYSLVLLVYSTVYSSLPPFTALSFNLAPAEISSSKFLIKIAVSENDVVICPV